MRGWVDGCRNPWVPSHMPLLHAALCTGVHAQQLVCLAELQACAPGLTPPPPDGTTGRAHAHPNPAGTANRTHRRPSNTTTPGVNHRTIHQPPMPATRVNHRPWARCRSRRASAQTPWTPSRWWGRRSPMTPAASSRSTSARPSRPAARRRVVGAGAWSAVRSLARRPPPAATPPNAH